MITIKNEQEIESLRKAGKIVADVLHLVRDIIRPGLDTLTLDTEAEKLIIASGAHPAFKGYTVPGTPVPFPGTLCISINDEVVHGKPDRDRILEEGDVVSIDVGARFEGFYGDAACTFPVGAISSEREALLRVTRECLERAVSVAWDGATLGDIGHAVESWAVPRGYGVVREYAGHGIGRKLHEAPQIPNYGTPGKGITLKGNVLGHRTDDHDRKRGGKDSEGRMDRGNGRWLRCRPFRRPSSSPKTAEVITPWD